MLVPPRRDAIAFISNYEHPSRDNIERAVALAFPEYHLENVKVIDVIKSNRHWHLPNLYHLAADFGGKIAACRANVRDSYFRTGYLFHRVRTAMAQIIDPRRHAFSFQVQSLFDTSVPGVPNFVYTDHTHLSNLEYSFFDRRRLRPPRWLALETTIYQNAARIFTRSHNISADLVKHYAMPPEKIACVYAGANVPLQSGYQLANDGYANKRILFIGGDWVRKGGPILAEAFKKVLGAHPDAHLTIAGTSPNLKLNLQNCHVLGKLSLTELSLHLAQSSIFCLPTRVEPFGVAILDAMLHKLPVVATSVGAIPDMVQEGVSGHLVPPGDSQQLAQALIRLLDSPSRCRRLGEAGYNLASARYTWPAVGDRLRAEVLSFLDGRATRAAGPTL
jgi:glycosyltransferase involved in cell wall biosynthesis